MPKFSVGNLERNNQVIEKFIEEHYGVSLKLKAIISDEVEPEKNVEIIEEAVLSKEANEMMLLQGFWKYLTEKF